MTKKKVLSQFPIAESHFFEVVKNLSLAVVFLDHHGDIRYVNDHLLDLTGYELDEVIGQSWFQMFIPPEERDMVRGVFDRLIDGQLPNASHHENTVLTNEGVALTIAWNNNRLLGENGETIGVNAIGEDITRLKRTSLALQEKEAFLTSVLDNTIDGIISIAEDGRILSFNKAAEDMFGYVPEEVLGHNVNMLMPSPYRDQHDNYIINYLTSGLPRIIGKGREVVGLRKDGTQFPFFLSVGREIRLGSRLVFVGTVRDLSREKRFENQLRRAQKMESIGTLAGGIAHDFNNLLGGILGYVDLMLEDVDEDSYMHEDLLEMQKACARGKDLILQILTFSRQDAPKKEPMHLHPIVKESLKLLRATIPSTITFDMRIKTDCPPIIGDPTQIHQVMMNLGTNAYHAMQGKGALTVSLEPVTIDAHYDETDHHLPFGDYVLLKVTDTGSGIDEEIRSRIFDPFFTTKEVGQGTGMGLAVVHGIVRGHMGDIDVRSVPGKGSTFYLFFPVYQETPDQRVTSEEPAGKGAENIMLVDDEAILLKVHQRILSRAGYEVRTYEDGIAAFEAFSDDPAWPDLVITDQTMPGMTGSELAVEMMGIRADLPIVLTTGFNELISPEQAKELGFRDFLMKPVRKQELMRVIRTLLD